MSATYCESTYEWPQARTMSVCSSSGTGHGEQACGECWRVTVDVEVRVLTVRHEWVCTRLATGACMLDLSTSSGTLPSFRTWQAWKQLRAYMLVDQQGHVCMLAWVMEWEAGCLDGRVPVRRCSLLGCDDLCLAGRAGMPHI
eukprot:377895-Pelagomonas_calceolata.AAC.6